MSDARSLTRLAIVGDGSVFCAFFSAKRKNLAVMILLGSRLALWRVEACFRTKETNQTISRHTPMKTTVISITAAIITAAFSGFAQAGSGPATVEHQLEGTFAQL